MRLMIFKQDEGPLDTDFKAGDIFQIFDNSWVPGTEEWMMWLVVQMELGAIPVDELLSSEYAPGPGAEAVIRRMRKYRLNYEARLTPAEIDDSGGKYFEGRLTSADIVRK